MTDFNLLIFFCPGSRGDFLAAVLTDQIQFCYKKFITYPGITYHKMHGLRPDNPWDSSLNESSILKYKDNSIKINITPNDYNLIATLTRLKELALPMHTAFMQNWVQQYCYLDDQFKYLVNFTDLFDVKFLADFYHQYNNRAMLPDHIKMMQYNIDLQLRHAKSAKPTS